MKRVLPALLAAPAMLGLQVDPKISEVRIDSLGPLFNVEYLELTGIEGSSLDGLSLLVIGDEDNSINASCGNSGWVESVTHLDGTEIPADRTFLIHASSLLLVKPDLIVDLALEDADNLTVLLVRGATVRAGEYLDLDNDGALDATPWKSLVDGVAFVWGTPGVASEHVYAANRAAATGVAFVFQARRCLDTDAWAIGATSYPGASESAGRLNPPCAGVLCAGDLNSDATIGAADLAIVLSNWGAIGTRGDANSDAVVDAADLALVLANWGFCDL
ncbi:MAG: hypothetical protein NTU45_13400 [Planctomycetota bacterium]|nr:hypothetical protein [Planctomycetota bacterium]